MTAQPATDHEYRPRVRPVAAKTCSAFRPTGTAVEPRRHGGTVTAGVPSDEWLMVVTRNEIVMLLLNPARATVYVEVDGCRRVLLPSAGGPDALRQDTGQLGRLLTE